MSTQRVAFTVGQRVLWHSAKGYTPPTGEIGVIDKVFDGGWVRLTLDLNVEEAAETPEFGGKCSMCMPASELTATNEICGTGGRTSAEVTVPEGDDSRIGPQPTSGSRGTSSQGTHTAGLMRLDQAMDISPALLDGRYHCLAVGDGYSDPPDTHGFRLTAFMSREDAERLQRCWNSHDELLAALQLFIKQWNTCGPNSDFGRYFSNVRDAAVAVIASVEASK